MRSGGGDARAVWGLDTALACYEAHVECARHLRHAVHLGHRVSEMLDSRRAPPGFKASFRRALARQPPFIVGAARLRQALDSVLCADVDRHQEHALRDQCPHLPWVVAVYFGWEVPATQAAAYTEATALAIRDVARVHEFAGAMRAALARARDLRRQTSLPASDARRQLLDDLVSRHSRALGSLEDRVRHLAAAAIQRAWRRAWYEPGMGVWRRRMLREFEELSRSAVE